ncbi:YIEGIA domain-containing protein [Clostridium beijerinckii]|uniref:YIEGIA protein n=1 Tax=Clostridium beijerinckii TaxID=1520 RepID=A0A1S9N538_CLOBE|nr:YIEGIA domain-containing protein [Clostridium beijerinckii]MZK51095.1 YIEGIA protein [Clostridium beijerinckii]MZK59297.1 YIEGIA protein [Clostridium beijerinckii]MZK69416.1 YIEGIA protein [Clostridium beijerinckii]MZK74789.1 YIEGIA protein [Clostridium beijerinckii]MZK84507.1 YIEGIA protein [Clostridium beijerinckii]
MNNESISQYYIYFILIPVLCGTAARYITLVVDYRQYPTYPNGYLINLVTGFISSGIGAIAIPALLDKNFEAVTFLLLATEQFREVRRIEKESLQALDDVEHVFRGEAYIDGIAKTFEARNYFSLLVSFVTSLIMHIVPNSTLLINIICGIIAGFITLYILKNFSKGKSVGDIAEVKLAKITVKKSELYVNDILVTNHLGTDISRELVQTSGIASIIFPRERHFSRILDHHGQTQAIIFEVCRALGVKRYHYTKRDYKTGRIAVVMVPIIHDENIFIETIKKTPLLESIKKSFNLMNSNNK